MYLLYVDESGQHGGSHFVLSGVAVFERQTYWLAKELDQIQRDILPDTDDSIEFHASEIRAGRAEPWNTLDQKLLRELLDRVYDAIHESRVALFADSGAIRTLIPIESGH